MRSKTCSAALIGRHVKLANKTHVPNPMNVLITPYRGVPKGRLYGLTMLARADVAIHYRETRLHANKVRLQI